VETQIFLAKRLKNTIFARFKFSFRKFEPNIFNIKSTMIKLFYSCLLVLWVVSFAQQGTSSPYSYYGIDVRYKVLLKCVRWQEAVEQDSIHLNMDNCHLNLSFHFSVGGSYNTSKLQSVLCQDYYSNYFGLFSCWIAFG
jgi:hypothetical protein